MIPATAAPEGTMSMATTATIPSGGSVGGDQMLGGKNNDVAYGEAGKDDVYGNTGNGAVFCGGGDDTLFGSAGTDTLVGGQGKDTLNGGGGKDVFVFAENYCTDKVTGFKGVDRLDLEGVRVRVQGGGVGCLCGGRVRRG